MTIGNFDTIFKLVVGEEGGYVNDPKDRGGPTKFGVTQATLAAWRRRNVSAADVRNLGIDEAKLIFRAQYWNKVRGSDLPDGVDLAVVDTAYNSGPGRAAEILQRAVGVGVDRIVGEKTLSAVGTEDPIELIDKIAKARLAFLKTTYGWSRYAKGWSARVKRVTAAAVAMTHPQLAGSVALTSMPPMEGGEAAHNQAISRTSSGQAKILAGVGALGTAATDAAQQVQPLMDYLPTLKWIFVALTVVGIGIGFWIQIKNLQAEARQ